MLQPEPALTIFEQIYADATIVTILREAGLSGVSLALSSGRDYHPSGRRSRAIYDEIHASLGDLLKAIGGYSEEPSGHLRWNLPPGRYSHAVQIAVCKGQRLDTHLHVARKKRLTEDFIYPNSYYMGQGTFDIFPLPPQAVGLYLSHELTPEGWLRLYLAMPKDLINGGKCFACGQIREIYSAPIGFTVITDSSSVPPAADVEVHLEDNEEEDEDDDIEKGGEV